MSRLVLTFAALVAAANLAAAHLPGPDGVRQLLAWLRNSHHDAPTLELFPGLAGAA